MWLIMPNDPHSCCLKKIWMRLNGDFKDKKDTLGHFSHSLNEAMDDRNDLFVCKEVALVQKLVTSQHRNNQIFRFRSMYCSI